MRSSLYVHSMALPVVGDSTAMATASSVDSRPSSERQAVLVYLRLWQTQTLTDEACFVASTPKELLAIPPKESQTFKNGARESNLKFMFTKIFDTNTGQKELKHYDIIIYVGSGATSWSRRQRQLKESLLKLVCHVVYSAISLTQRCLVLSNASIHKRYVVAG